MSTNPPQPPPRQPPESLPDPAGVLQAARLDDPSTLDAVGDLRVRDDGVAAARNLLGQQGLSLDQRWAAVYVYGNGGDDPAPLLGWVADPDPSVRLMAAMALIARGRQEGFAPVVDALSEPDTELVAGSHPPLRRWSCAATTLVAATGRSDLGPALDADPALRARAQAGWREWLTATLPTLRFDASVGDWS